MKKLVLVSLLFAVTICNAQVKSQINKEIFYNTELNLLEWSDPEITSDPEASKYDSKFSEAVSNPGEKILGERSEKTLKLKVLFKKQVEIREHFIVYNSQTRNIDYIEAAPIIKEKSSYLIWFSIASIILMIISNILYNKRYNRLAIFASVLVFSLVVAAGVFADFSFIALTAGAFAGAFILITFTIVEVDSEYYEAISIMYYILMAIHIVWLFI